MRTSLKDTETIVWEGYNTIREIESTFRTLKTDLDLRPIYHKRDDATLAHINLGLLAYWVVNTIRFQLKRSETKNTETKNTETEKIGKENAETKKTEPKNIKIKKNNTTDNQTINASINFCWKEIIRTMNTQKAVTTTAQNNFEEIILIRRCSEPNEKVKAIYEKLKYKIQPYTKRKFVVHKSEMEKMEYQIYQGVWT